MIAIYGHRLYGKIDRCGSTFIATRFFHIQFIPLIPLGSHLVLSTQGRQFQSYPLGWNTRSVVAGYARVIGTAAALIAGVTALVFATDGEHDLVDVLSTAVIALLGAIASIAAFVLVGRLSVAERAQRLAYAQHVGHSIDVALLPEPQRAQLRHTLSQHVTDRARQLVATSGYRGPVDPGSQWALAALDPGVSDPTFLTAAVTLARLEWAASSGDVRQAIDRTHGAILDKLMRADPRLPAAASAPGA